MINPPVLSQTFSRKHFQNETGCSLECYPIPHPPPPQKNLYSLVLNIRRAALDKTRGPSCNCSDPPGAPTGKPRSRGQSGQSTHLQLLSVAEPEVSEPFSLNCLFPASRGSHSEHRVSATKPIHSGDMIISESLFWVQASSAAIS